MSKNVRGARNVRGKNRRGLETDRAAEKTTNPFMKAAAVPVEPPASQAPDGDVTPTQEESPFASPAAQPAPKSTAPNTRRNLEDLLRSMKPPQQTKPTSVRISAMLKGRITDQINEFTKRFPDFRPPSQSDVIAAALRHYMASLEQAVDSGDHEELERLWTYLVMSDGRLDS